MKEVEMIATTVGTPRLLTCPKCKSRVTVVFVLHSKWRISFCIECCFYYADRHKMVISNDPRKSWHDQARKIARGDNNERS